MLFLLYLVAGYWAAGVVFYENKIIFHKTGELFMRKVVWGAVLGMFLIPIAIIKRVLHLK